MTHRADRAQPSPAVSMQRPDAKYFVGLSMLPGIGAIRLGRLIDGTGSAEAAWQAGPEDLRACGVDEKSLVALLERRPKIDLNAAIERLDRAGARVVTWNDPEYPSPLRETFNRPAILYIRGTIQESDAEALAIVGTRRPTSYGKAQVMRIAPPLVERGLTIVSGMARGIDTFAHRAALDAGGRTIAVLGSGLDVIYPWENKGLAERIAQNGAVISEYALGTQPDAFNFPMRNRIISGLSLGTLIVEAGEKSGALRTANFAVDQNREVFACPGRISDGQSAGCNRLIQQGQAKLITSPDDILDELNLASVPKQLQIDYSIAANPTERKILELLSAQPVHVDDLGRQASLAAPDVTSTLTMLELRGVIRHVGAMHYVLAR
jgi:DNA processing protein